jgi:protein TonB
MASPLETFALLSRPPAAEVPLALSSSGRGFDATTVILIVLAAIAGYLVYEFIRDAKGRSSVAIVGAVLGHVLLVLFLSLDIPGKLGCGLQDPKFELVEFEVAQIDEPEPEPEPKEEEPPPEEPQQPTEVKPKEPPPKKTKKAEEPKPEEPVNPEPAPAKRWDLSQTTQGGNSGVTVEQGSGGEYGGTGKPDSKGTKKPSGGDPKGDEDGTESKWQPRSELFIKDMPQAVKVPKIECPATAELGVQGDVILKVQITAEGKVRDVKLVKGIGQGCDQIAIKALKQARFKPAVGTNGKPVDFELRYEYAFTVND